MELVSLLNARKGLTIRVHSAPFSDTFVQSLFSLASSLGNESKSAFERHVATVSEVHTLHNLKDPNHSLLGFQMWPRIRRQRVISGGKLRLTPHGRGVAFPHISGLLYLQNQKNRENELPFLRMSIASVFGFNALMPAVSQWSVLRKGEAPELLMEEVQQFCVENGFDFDAATGVADVKFSLSPTLLREASSNPTFVSREAVKCYSQHVPTWQQPNSTKYLCWWWEFNEQNIASMTHFARTRLLY